MRGKSPNQMLFLSFYPFLPSSYFPVTDVLYVKHTIHDLEGNSLEDYKKGKWKNLSIRAKKEVLNIHGFKNEVL